MAAAVQPEKILRDLRDLWSQLGREQQSSGGVLRACAMTLLVVAEDEADAERVRQTLGVLMHDHPSRAIVLKAAAGAELDARVFAECWMPFGSHRQICAEGIEITADSAHLNQVPHLVLPLIVPDLPVVLWCRGNRPFASEGFDALLPLAEKTIFDSAGVGDSHAAIEILKELRARGRRVADLAWARLTGWREAVAHVFDDSLVPASSVNSVNITHGAAASTSVLYFATWVERAIPSAQVTLQSASGDPGLQSVTLSGGSAEIAIRLADASSVEIRAGERSSRSLLPPATDDALMREELGIVGPDFAFDSILK